MEQIYKELNIKVGFEQSRTLQEIWKTLCSDEEAKVANLLPGTVDKIAQKTGNTVDETINILTLLFQRGVAFKFKKDDEIWYKLAKNIVQLHDSTLLWDGATQEFFDLWKTVMDDEFTSLMKQLPKDFTMPAFLRVVPINTTIEHENTVLSFEECEMLINESEQIAVIKCPCRLSQQNCDASIEACIQINRGARYVLDRGHGRQITRDEAIRILRRSEDEGLVHMTENRDKVNVICNCCSCCCEMFRMVKHSGAKWITSPSRFLAVVDDDLCIQCGDCIDVCPVEAVSLNGTIKINKEECIGCGLCAKHCSFDAMGLKEIRPESHIPVIN